LAFTTTTGAGGTSLIGTSGVDTQTVAGSAFPLYLGAQGGRDVIAFTTAPITSLTANLGAANDTASFVAAADVTGSTVNAGLGEDTITLTGDFDTSTLRGGSGDDALTVTVAEDSFVNANAGEDTINVNGDLDGTTILGGADDDTIAVGNIAASDSSRINGNKGDDTITVNVDTTAMASSTIYGGAGDDTINATTSLAAVILSGDNGDDTITGGEAADTLFGGAGDDVIGADDAIGDDVDRFTGGAGDDTFTFLGDTGAGATLAAVTTDIITDFVAADDNVRFATAGAVSLYSTATDYTGALTDGTIYVVSGTITNGVFAQADITAGGFDTAIVYADGAGGGGFEANENSVLLEGVLADTITGSNITFA